MACTFQWTTDVPSFFIMFNMLSTTIGRTLSIYPISRTLIVAGLCTKILHFVGSGQL